MAKKARTSRAKPPAPGGVGGAPVLTETPDGYVVGARAAMQLAQRQIRWGMMTPELRAWWVEQARKLADHKNPRVKLRALELLLHAESQNQSDDHHAADVKRGAGEGNKTQNNTIVLIGADEKRLFTPPGLPQPSDQSSTSSAGSSS